MNRSICRWRGKVIFFQSWQSVRCLSTHDFLLLGSPSDLYEHSSCKNHLPIHMQNRPKLTSVVLTLGVICCCSITQLILTDPEAFLPENKLKRFMWTLEFWRKNLCWNPSSREQDSLRIPQEIHFPSTRLWIDHRSLETRTLKELWLYPQHISTRYDDGCNWGNPTHGSHGTVILIHYFHSQIIQRVSEH